MVRNRNKIVELNLYSKTENLTFIKCKERTAADSNNNNGNNQSNIVYIQLEVQLFSTNTTYTPYTL